MAARNPFEITKAVDFSDSEIVKNFVDFPNGGFQRIGDPASPTVQFIVGGKGGGRTHLMRHWSYPLRSMDGEDTARQVAEDGYLGIYFRCSGLNALRFSGGGVDDDTWRTVFAFYMDSWLTMLAVEAVVALGASNLGMDVVAEAAWAQSVANMLAKDNATWETAVQVHNGLKDILRDIDIEVNRASLRRSASFPAPTSPGQLPFMVVQGLGMIAPVLSNVTITFLLDEFENLSLEQQKYVHTLIRHKVLPVSFIIGSRQSGLKTTETYSAGEANKRGSEFSLTVLEESYASMRSDYSQFCKELVRRRLGENGFAPDAWTWALGNRDTSDRFSSEELLDVIRASSVTERPYLIRLAKALQSVWIDHAMVTDVVNALRIPDEPLLEKLAVFSFYQAWSAGGELTVGAANLIRKDVVSLKGNAPEARMLTRWGHFRGDLRAQFYSEFGRRPPVNSLEDLIDISGFLPRNLLVLLKSIAKWSLFNGEEPFTPGAAISYRARELGVQEAADWFADDARPLGPDGRAADVAIRRVGGFLRRLRLSDKPVESSLSSFATDLQGISHGAHRTLETALASGMLTESTNGQKDRNSGSRLRVFQLHPMVAIQYDLPTARRGVTRLTSEEFNVLFSSDVSDEVVDRVTSKRVGRMNAPFIVPDPGQGWFFALD